MERHGTPTNFDIDPATEVGIWQRVKLDGNGLIVVADENDWGIGVAYRPKVAGDDYKTIAVHEFKNAGEFRVVANEAIAKGAKVEADVNGYVKESSGSGNGTAKEAAADGEEFIIIAD